MCLTASIALLALGLGCGPAHPAGRQQPGTPTRAGLFVAPTGTPAGNGSAQRPWDLQYALSGAQGPVHAGDTVWLRRYEAGRAHIVVYNWGGGADVAVDVGTVLKPGDRY